MTSSCSITINQRVTNMRHHTFVASLLLAIPLLSHSAVVTLTVNGQITSTQTRYDVFGDIAIPGVTAEDLAIARNALAPLQAGQAVQVSYTFNTDEQSWHKETPFGMGPDGQPLNLPDQIIGGRFRSPDNKIGNVTTTISVLEAGVNDSQTALSNAGSRFFRIRATDNAGVAEGSYMDFQMANDAARWGRPPVTSRTYDSSISYTLQSGKDYQEHDLLALLSNFPYADATGASGRVSVFDPICTAFRGQCGFASFDILSTSLQVASVPEPSTWLLMGLGLAGMAGVRSNRRQSQRR